ncbi:uncharacterized protein QC763_206920 [Podospora pseudopauciseta]|uniref:HD domain-containing protein n=1 Tax=Podospora pseudopauciseta TaxID=2093780 RepID=A0ABR0HP68_9PEZI|nr:hypothetical protein QC763_206920 [Podospora pseudopauciseta]
MTIYKDKYSRKFRARYSGRSCLQHPTKTLSSPTQSKSPHLKTPITMHIQNLISSSFLLLLSFPISTTATTPRPPYPNRTLVGITMIDTPIVRDAQAYARRYCSDSTYNHIMRSWLLGLLHLSHDPALASKIDLEVHALGLILHDLATNHSLSAPFVTPNRRFEVDSAIAAADFIRSHPDGKKWPGWRVQRVWDGIALHAEPGLALYKEADVFAIYWGNELEFSWERPGGERKGVTAEERERVLQEFPRPTLEEGGRGNVFAFVAWYCKYKPESTYNTWMQPFGELLVPGYSAVGHRVIDGSLAAVGLNMSEILK